MSELRFKKLGPCAKSPSRGSPAAAGLDLYAAETVSIPSFGRACVKTDIAVEVPSGYYGRIAARSGLALSRGLIVGGGVVDSDFRGNVGVILFNLGEQPFEVSVGDRVAQLVVEKIAVLQPSGVDSLDPSSCGASGLVPPVFDMTC